MAIVYNVLMYEFSFGAFFLGLIILAVGGAITVFYQKLADNLGGGVSSHERFRLAGLITCGVGFIIMTGLHTIPLNWLMHSLFGV